MKKILFLFVAIIVSGCCMASKSKENNGSKPLVKMYIAEGWKPIPGYKSIKEQVQDLLGNKDTTIICGHGSATADDLISAHNKAYYIAILDAVQQYNLTLDSISTDIIDIPSQTLNLPKKNKNVGLSCEATFYIEGVADWVAKESAEEKSEIWANEYFIELSSTSEDVKDSSTLFCYNEGYVNTSHIVNVLCVYRTTKDGKIEVMITLHAPAGSISLKKPILQDHQKVED